MALFIGESLSVLLTGVYVFIVCWYRFYQSPWMLAGVTVFLGGVLIAFFVLGRAFPDEIVDYQAGVIEFPGLTSSQIMLAELREIRLLRTRKGNVKQPVEFVLQKNGVIKGYGSYKFFRDISNYAEVLDVDATPFYPKETIFTRVLCCGCCRRWPRWQALFPCTGVRNFNRVF